MLLMTTVRECKVPRGRERGIGSVKKWGEEKGGKTIEKTVRVVRFCDLPGGVEVGGKECCDCHKIL